MITSPARTGGLYSEAEDLADKFERTARVLRRAHEQVMTGDRHVDGLRNIKAFAAALQPKLNGMEVKVGGVEMGVFLSALRDYCGEVIDGTQVKNRTRSHMTSDCSAASRWGVDFTSPPTK